MREQQNQEKRIAIYLENCVRGDYQWIQTNMGTGKGSTVGLLRKKRRDHRGFTKK